MHVPAFAGFLFLPWHTNLLPRSLRVGTLIGVELHEQRSSRSSHALLARQPTAEEGVVLGTYTEHECTRIRHET